MNLLKPFWLLFWFVCSGSLLAEPFYWHGAVYGPSGSESMESGSPRSICDQHVSNLNAFWFDHGNPDGHYWAVGAFAHGSNPQAVRQFACRADLINGVSGSVITFNSTTIGLRGDGCPSGAAMFGSECAMPDPGVCEGGAHRGNPINVGSGNKFERESDYAGVEGLVFERFYNSRSHRYTDAWSMRLGARESVETLLDHSGRLGAHWRHAFSRVLLKSGPRSAERYINETFTPVYDCQSCHGLGLPAADNVDLRAEVYLLRPDGRHRVFQEQADGVWVGQDSAPGRLTEALDAQGDTVSWQYLNRNHETEIYNAQGRLLFIELPSGQTLQLSYDAVTERLLTVTDAGGRTLTFHYDSAGRIDALHDPAGGVFEYTYDTQGNLIEVTYPDHTTRRYRYEAPQLPSALTAIDDETGAEYARFAYELFISGPSPEENIGRAVLSEHAGGAERITVDYTADGAIVTETIDASRNVFAVSDYGFEKHNTGYKPASIEGDACTDCGNVAHNEYDEAGRIILRTDPNGHQTEYDYNDRDLEVRRTEAFNTPQARTITTDWHPMYRLPIQITEPRKITEYTYDDLHSTANVLEKREIDTSGACAPGSNPPPAPEQCERITVYHYYPPGHLNAHRLQQIDGPRTDVNDITAFEYDSEGNPISITNALGHVTDITEHDAHGNPLTIIDPNGVITALQYDARQRLIQRTVAVGTLEAATTQFDYYPNGLLERITDPMGVSLHYHYDAAQRLTRIDDALGNTITYTLDNASNRIQTNTRDPQGTLTQTQTAIYNSLNRLAEQLGAQNQTTAFDYDANGNPTQITNPKQQTTVQSYDALNRLVEQLDPEGGVTRYDYNDADQLIRVEDPNTLNTEYQYNGFDELIYQNSPDTGEMHYQYDQAGNLIEQTDARGVTVHYRYDALNRITDIDYPDHPSGIDEDIRYTYDYNGLNHPGLGRVTHIGHGSGSLAYRYDARGNITQQTVGWITPAGTYLLKGLVYQYNLADRLIQIRYPSYRTIDYQYNSAGQISRITSTQHGQTETLTDNIQYQPFGPVHQATLGNGLTLNYHYDMDARLSQQTTSGIIEHTYDYDLNSNIEQIIRPQNPGHTQTLDYDALNRLIQANSPAANHSYTYDPTGNRETRTLDGQTDTYTYIQNTHRLDSISGSQSQHYQYGPAGHLTQRNSDILTYNQAGRLQRITTHGQTTEYRYNALGQRTHKIQTQNNAPHYTYYLYDLQGRLAAEINDHGDSQTEYTYLNNQPLVQWQISTIHAPVYTFQGLEGTHLQDKRILTATLDQTNQTLQITQDSTTQNYSQHQITDGQVWSFTDVEYRYTRWEIHDHAWRAHILIDTTESQTEGRVYYGILAHEHNGIVTNYNLIPDQVDIGYYHNDHLGTPQKLTDQNQTIVWEATYTPFGMATVNEDPDSDGNSVTQNIRFPGQYFDQETGLHYNYHRYYDPGTGRYLTADPLGAVIYDEDEEQFKLNHLYAYTANNPIRFIDPFGLSPQQCSDKPKDKKKKKDCKKQCKPMKGRANALCLLACVIFSMADDDPRNVGRVPRPDQEPKPIPAPRRPNPNDPDKKPKPKK